MRMREKAPVRKKRHQHPPKKSALERQLQISEGDDEQDGPVVFNAGEPFEADNGSGYDPDGIMDINATVICEKDSHKGIVIGKGGSMLKKIGSMARSDIEELLGCQVNLQLFVKVRRDWRDDRNQLKSFGYDMKDYR